MAQSYGGYNRKPTLDYSTLTRELAQKGPQSLYLLWGEEDYLLWDFVQRVRTACLEGGTGDFDAHRLDGPIPDAAQVEEALDAMPFFGGRTYLEIRSADVNKWKEERLQAAFSDIPEWCTVVLVLPPETGPDGRLSFIKQLKEKGKAVEFTAQDTALLYKWLQRRFEAHGKTIGRQAMDRLLFLSGELMTGLIPEIEKICAYAPEATVTVSDVEAVAHHIPEADVFEMTEDLARGKMNEAVHLLSELLSDDREPPEILGTLSWQMRRLYAARVADSAGQGPSLVRELLGIKSEFTLRKTLELARRFSVDSLRRCVRLCAEAFLWSRDSAGAIEETDALKELLMRLYLEIRHA